MNWPGPRNRKIVVLESQEELAVKGAEIFVAQANRAVLEKDYFVVAISGGNTPRPMHRLLVTPGFVEDIPWDQIHIFWADERMVPYDSEHSNYGAALQDFLGKAPIPPENLHPILVDRAPGEAALIYEDEILRFFGLPKGAVPRFDLIFLGMGTDGHTASLFRAQGALWDAHRLAVDTLGTNPNLPRVTITPTLINNASMVVFMVAGADKALTAKDVITNPQSNFVAARIAPRNGQLIWLLDRAAAHHLNHQHK